MADLCCCSENEDGQPLQPRPQADERQPVVRQPVPRSYSAGNQKLEWEVEKLREEKEEFSKQLQNLYGKLKEKDERYEADIGIRELEIRKLKLDVSKLETQNGELPTRLSASASAQLTDDNPNIADLSDLNRPTKLAEQFSELYDNEWTDAFDSLTKTARRTDEDACKLLLNVITKIFSKCHTKAMDDFQTITEALGSYNGMDVQSKEVLKTLKDDRKKNYRTAIPELEKDIQLSLTEIVTEQDAHLISAYIKSATTICWLMAIQDPPVHMDVVTGIHCSRFDMDKYKHYTRTGGLIDFVVWPVLYLHEGGNMLGKGVAQGMNTEDSAQVMKAEDTAEGMKTENSAHGMNGEDSTHGMNEEDSAHGMNEEDSAHGMNPEDSAHGMNEEDSAQGMNAEDSAQVMKAEDTAEGMKTENSAYGMNPEDSAHGMNEEDSAHGMNAEDSALDFENKRF